ncbi:DUF1048 domain-containing protein [Clostridium sp. WILCCON 0269]|uniref:DUF1048 domain-containing protein n=1 Tax=Candidatus Clostridium eludens TaxID=3381663 RepID=A0ABW8SIG5_9CLOT
MLLQWQFKKIRLKEQKKLNETNLYLYKAITIYIQNSNLRLIEKEEILQQIMDMILQSQVENRSVDLIIGQDYEKFCESIIEEYRSSKNTVYNVLNCMQKYLIWMVSIALFMSLLNGIIIHSLNLGINMNQFVMANVVALIIIPASKKEKQKNSSIFYLPQRLYAMNKGLVQSGIYAIILISLVSVILKFILQKVLDWRTFSYTIILYKVLPYMLIIILVITLIEIYKRIYDRDVII